MSLRSIGNQLLQTAPSPLLAGASTASLSFWAQVNPACNVANTNGVEIFGDAGGKLSATLSGSGGLRIGWLSQNAGTNGSSSCGLTLAPGTSYHVATTWQSGTQCYYLNGIQVHADTQVGSIGVVGDSSPHPFRLGSDSAGTDVTLDEPTLWVGYALSAQDVLNLRNRVVLPGVVAPSSIALQWSLAGTNGVAIHLGDAGLADSSATGLNLTTIVGTAPTYQGGILSYLPPPKIGTSVAPSGQGISLLFEDGLGNPSNIVSLRSSSDLQTITVAGLPAGGTFTLGFGGQTTAPISVTTGLATGHGLWSLTGLTAGQSYQLANATVSNGPNTALFQIYDGALGATLLGSDTVNEYGNGDYDFNYGLRGDGITPMGWKRIGAPVTPSGTTLTMLVTCPTGTGRYAYSDALYVQKVSDSSIVVYDQLGPQFSGGGGGNTASANTWDGSFYFFTGTGSLNTYSLSASAVQVALLSLSTVRAGGLTVSTADNVNYSVSFVGPMRDAVQPTLVSSDPAVTVAHTLAGASVPSIIVPRLNGGSPIELLDWIWCITNAPQMPFAYCPFQQPSATPQRANTQMGLVSRTGSGWGAVIVGAQYGGYTFISSNAGDTYTFAFQGLTPGTYQVSATWVGTSAACTKTHFLINDSNGTTLDTVVVDQTQNPAGFADAGVTWQVVGSVTIASPITGLELVLVVPPSPGGYVFAVGAEVARTFTPTPINLLASDVVTLSCPAGWGTSVAGAVGAITNQAVVNQVGQGSIVPFVANTKAMKVGYNVEQDTVAELIYRFSNLANRIQGPLGLTYDVNGYPLTTAGPSVSALVAGQVTYNSGANGLYVVKWNGIHSNLSIGGASTTVTEVPNLAVVGGMAGNVRVFHLQATGSDVSPSFSVGITSATLDPSDGTHSNYLQDVQNLRIYPPDPSDPTGMTPWGIVTTPPEWHPTFTGTMLKGVQSLRFMDVLMTNNSAVVEFADYIQTSRLGYFDPSKIINVAVSDYRGYSGNDPAFDISNYVIIQLTTGTPHGFVDGQRLFCQVPGTVTLSNAVTYPATNCYGMARVLSPTQLLLPLQTNINTTGITMTNVLSGGVVQATVGGGPFDICVSLPNAIPSVTDIFVNVPIPASDACVTAMFNYLGANLKAGCKIHCEYSNETWNTGFGNWYACCQLSRTLGLGGFDNYSSGYVHRANQVHNLAQAALATHGRSADLVRTFGVQGSYAANSTTPIVAYAHANGIPIDEVASAPYFDNSPYEPSLQYLYDFQTTDQDLDLLFLSVEYNGIIPLFISSHRPILDAAGYTSAAIVCYEGSPNILYSQPTASNPEGRNHAIARHPRMYWWMLAFLQALQDQGCSLYNDFYVAGGLQTYAWSAWWNWNQQPGTGDPTLDALNISNPESQTGIKSEVGGAMTRWALLNPGIHPTPKPTMPGRNGQIRSVGYPRGMFRPSR